MVQLAEKRILITGGSGFLGRRAAAHFRALGWQVFTPAHGELDITKPAAVLEWFAKNRPQAALHCAAVSDTGRCQQQPEETARINVDGAANVAAGCAAVGAKLLLCSSDQVYAGSLLPGPHREDEPLSPGNVYARQKLLAEQRCTALCLDTVALRLSWMYARDSYPGEHGHFLATLAAALREETVPIRWPIHDHRGITDVQEVVQNLPEALSLPAGVYNFGAENDMDTHHTVEAVLNALSLEGALRRLTPNEEAFAQCPRDIRMDLSRAKEKGIGFKNTREGLCAALWEMR